MEKSAFSSTRGLLPTSTAMKQERENCPVWLSQAPQIPAPLFPNPRLAAMTAPAGVGAEKFRALAVRLKYLQEHRDLKRIVITSTIKGEGKSVVAANLAITCSHRERTLLIDGDLRQSGLAELFGTRDMPGLTDWWQGKKDISEFLRLVQPTPLWYLPVGTGMTQPLEVLQSQRFVDMLAQVSEWFSWVIIDSPPVVPVADPNIWVGHADGTLLVVRQGKTPKRLLLKTLQEVGDLKLLGVVMNESRDVSHQYYAQYYRATPHANTARSLRKRQLAQPDAKNLVIE